MDTPYGGIGSYHLVDTEKKIRHIKQRARHTTKAMLPWVISGLFVETFCLYSPKSYLSGCNSTLAWRQIWMQR